MDLRAIVLAAGASRRFGSPKQLALYQGQPMLQHVLSCAVGVLNSSVTVVLGANAQDIVERLRRPDISFCFNLDWEEGIASSIRAGVRQLPVSCIGVVLLLGDLPRVSTSALQSLASIWTQRPEAIVASAFGEAVGAPAIFPRWSFGELLRLRGDEGARLLLRQHADKLVRVTTPEAAFDVDTPAELQCLNGLTLSPGMQESGL